MAKIKFKNNLTISRLRLIFCKINEIIIVIIIKKELPIIVNIIRIKKKL